MIENERYEQGLISIASDSNVVVGLGTRWLTYIVPGDEITINNETIEIASVDDFNQLILVSNYLGVNVDLNSYYISITANFERLKVSKKKEVISAYRNQVSDVTAQYEQSEIDTWHIQEAEARAYANDNSASVPFLTSQAAGRAITINQLAVMIVTKADIYITQVATILGKRQKLMTDIGLAETISDLNSISW